MRVYTTEFVTRSVERLVEIRCDGCNREESEAGPMFPVAIEINYGEEFGCRDEYDYCDDCLIARADIFVAAGSRSRLVVADGEA